MTVGDSFTWAFKDPEWLGKMLLQGLIAFIPIVGWIAMLGWMMLAIDNLKAGRMELPPAGFHLARGIGIFLVMLIYGIVLAVPAGVLLGLGAIVAAVTNSNDHSSVAALPLFILGYMLAFAAGLLIRVLYPALILQTNRAGFAGGMEVQKVLRVSTFNLGNTIIAALLIWVASLIGGLGIGLCLVGALFTIPYENTVNAGIVAWYDKESGPA
ncbi:MAG TPA: DUF4013 domain-containing protein [Candidatus Dormibacteraeota bacterium]|nr:DUF4013 domain-containing protein [Candidatus Dormibacteraeota bacterium]